jgi:hypothetical protein
LTTNTLLIQKNIYLLFCLFIFTASYSQKELWGYSSLDDGLIVKASLGGTDIEPEIVHTFDATGILGKSPKGRLFQASNGKLYGIAAYSNGVQGTLLALLFEYDPVVSRYKILTNTLNSDGGNLYGVIEPVPGMLYGTTNGGRSVFKYNIDTEEMSIVATIPPFVYNNSNYYPRFEGELMKASDGNLYGVTMMAPSVQNTPYPGGIYRINLNTNQVSKLYVFGLGGSDVQIPVYDSKLVEGAPGKLYGTAMGGQHVGPQGVAPQGSGTLYEFTIATATLVKKFDFDYNGIGSYPSPLIKSADNKLYGALFGLPNNITGYPNSDGSLFEYDLTTNTLNVLHVFDYQNDDYTKHPTGIALKATDGNFYGSNMTGIYSFNSVTDVIAKKIIAPFAHGLMDVIEICSKPSYQFFETSALTVCENTSFTFNIHNTNATTYVWKKGSVVLPSQTTGLLTFENTTPEDTGIYTCTMTNECGTTVTMPLQITVGCLGLDEAAILKNTVSLYPNPATNTLNIKLPDNPNFKIQDISISNMLGQIVYRNNDKTTNIDISFLKTGLYQLLLTTDKGEWNGRFIKE